MEKSSFKMYLLLSSMKKLAIYLLTIKKSREPTYIMFESIHVCHCVIKN